MSDRNVCCYHCDELIKQDVKYWELTSTDGDKYKLHNQCYRDSVTLV